MAKEWWENISDTLLKSAPTVLGALGGTLGTVIAPGAGTGVGAVLGKKAGEILAGIFGVPVDRPDAIIDAIKADPNAVLKLREAEMAMQLELARLANEKLKIDLDETKAYLSDVQSARQREIDIKKAGGSNLTFYSIGWIITLSFFGAIVLIVLKPIGIDSSMRDVLNMLLGYLASNFTTVVQYFFGSSKGSSDKQGLLAKLGEEMTANSSTKPIIKK